MTSKIYELEQALMNCWNVVDDLNMLEKSDEITKEHIKAFELIYQMKFQSMWNTFEDLCTEHHRFRNMAETGRANPVDFDIVFDDLETRLEEKIGEAY